MYITWHSIELIEDWRFIAAGFLSFVTTKIVFPHKLAIEGALRLHSCYTVGTKESSEGLENATSVACK